jgi:hypothetical protein
MVKLEARQYINKERNWMLVESRVFDKPMDNMLDAHLQIIDLNTMKKVTEVGGKEIDDVWEYDWTIII